MMLIRQREIERISDRNKITEVTVFQNDNTYFKRFY